MKVRQANKIIRKSRSSRLRLKRATWEKAWQNADTRVVVAVIGEDFRLVARAAAELGKQIEEMAKVKTWEL